MTRSAAARPNAAHAPVLKEPGLEDGLPRGEPAAAGVVALLVGAMIATRVAVGDGVVVGVGADACDGWPDGDRGAAVDLPLGTGVAVLAGVGVGEPGGGQTPPGDGGAKESLWLS